MRTGIKKLKVLFDAVEGRREVGLLAVGPDGRIVFAYAPSWVTSGFPIAPSLPLTTDGVRALPEPFEGLHGVFADSLPDGWGRLVLDRAVARAGIDHRRLTNLDRLAFVGSTAMGALRYEPDLSPEESDDYVDLDKIALDALALFEGGVVEDLDTLIKIGGSPGGARPKILVGLSSDASNIIHGSLKLPMGFEPYLVKFPGPDDGEEVGAVEFAYAIMAAEAGIDMSPTRLLPSRTGPGHFAVKRFDRSPTSSLHVATFAGLFHADHRLPSVDYENLLKGTNYLTRDHESVLQHFRRMVFNVFAKNRDDHTKNHAYVADGSGGWMISPAYDITPSSGPGGEHAIAVAGNGNNPGTEEVIAVGRALGLRDPFMVDAIERVRSAVSRWRVIAADVGVSRKVIQEVCEFIGDETGSVPPPPRPSKM